MSPVALALLRRLALLAVTAAVTLVVVFRLLPALGLLGPSAADEIAGAATAVRVAREYGAEPASEALARAETALEAGRRLVERGEERRARRVARDAGRLAIDAQRQALAMRESARQEALRVTRDLDAVLTELEDRYAELAESLDKASGKSLVARMRRVRRTGASLFLAYDRGEYSHVIASEAEAKAELGEAREALAGAERTRGPSPQVTPAAAAR